MIVKDPLYTFYFKCPCGNTNDIAHLDGNIMITFSEPITLIGHEKVHKENQWLTFKCQICTNIFEIGLKVNEAIHNIK